MLRALALFSVLSSPAFGFWGKGYRVRYAESNAGVGVSAFIEMPQSATEAYGRGWEEVTRPQGPPGYEQLVMWCPRNDYTFCVLYDDTGYIAGSQIAFDPERFDRAIYDWSAGGFTIWSRDVNGIIKKYWTIQQYYISSEALATDPNIRIATRNASVLLQEKYLYVPGFEGKLFSIPTEPSELRSSVYTEQACVAKMGNHWYYNMTSALSCSVETIFPWFPMDFDGQLTGLGFVWPGRYTVDYDKLFPFEEPIRLAIQMIVPDGPECLYEYGDYPGLITMHTYFIEGPYLMTCENSSSHLYIYHVITYMFIVMMLL